MNNKALWLWILRYLSGSPFVLLLYIVPVLASFFIFQGSHSVDMMSMVISMMLLFFSIDFSAKIANIFERKESFFYLSIPISISKLLIIMLICALIIATPASFIIFDNSGINISLPILELQLLYMLLYLCLGFIISLLFHKFQISTATLFAASWSPLIVAFFGASQNSKNIIPFFAISPFSGVFSLALGYHSVLTLWVPVYVIVILAIIPISIIFTSRRDVT